MARRSVGREATLSIPAVQRTIKGFGPAKQSIPSAETIMRPPGTSSDRRTPSPHPAMDYRPPAFLGTVRVVAIAAAALALLVILYVGYWFFMAQALRDGVMAWAEARGAEGYHVAYGGVAVSGFPLRFRITVTAPALGAPQGDPPWLWRAEGAVAELRPWRPGRAVFTVQGEQKVDVDAGALPLSYTSTEGVVGGEVVFADGRLAEARLEIDGLTLVGEDVAWNVVVKKATVKTRRNPARASDYRLSAADFRIEAADITLPKALFLPMGDKVARVHLVASVMGAVGPEPWPRWLPQWRDDGGTVEVSTLDLSYGPLSVLANGTLALDGDLQPIGAFTAKVQGFFETLDIVRDNGLVRDRDAVTAKLVLGVMARRPEGGGPPTVSLAITVQDHKVYAGPVPLATLPAIRWETIGRGP